MTEPDRPPADRCFRLTLDTPGTFDGITLRALPRRSPERGEVEIEVAAAGLNFLDVLLVLGVVPPFHLPEGAWPIFLGGECAGRIVAVGAAVSGLAVGQEVVALAPGSFASHVIAPADFVVPRPAGISAAEGATLGGAYLTAYYALHHVARLSRGERVLIHAGAGGVGLAAIQWAQHIGAEIFATVGSPEKHAYLQSLGVHRTADSRSDRFVAEVRGWTGGKGVDVVLNSLAGELLVKSFGLLDHFGRFIELGKRDYFADAQLGLKPFLKNLTFSLVDLHGLMVHRPQPLRAAFHELLGLVTSGVLKPLPHRTFAICQVADALRIMASGQHIGKLLLTMADPEARTLIAPTASVPHRPPPLREPGASLRMSSRELLLAELAALGVTLWVDGDKLRYRASKGALAPALLASLRVHKEELIATLAGPNNPA